MAAVVVAAAVRIADIVQVEVVSVQVVMLRFAALLIIHVFAAASSRGSFVVFVVVHVTLHGCLRGYVL